MPHHLAGEGGSQGLCGDIAQRCHHERDEGVNCGEFWMLKECQKDMIRVIKEVIGSRNKGDHCSGIRDKCIRNRFG